MIELAEVAAEIAAAAQVLSRHRHGAIMTWNPVTAVEGGIVIDAVVSRQLLVALSESNVLGTGVMVIRGHRIERAGVPIAWRHMVELAPKLAVGFAFAVDEDTGEIRRVARSGRVDVVDAFTLASELHRYALESRPQ